MMASLLAAQKVLLKDLSSADLMAELKVQSLVDEKAFEMVVSKVVY